MARDFRSDKEEKKEETQSTPSPHPVLYNLPCLSQNLPFQNFHVNTCNLLFLLQVFFFIVVVLSPFFSRSTSYKPSPYSQSFFLPLLHASMYFSHNASFPSYLHLSHQFCTYIHMIHQQPLPFLLFSLPPSYFSPVWPPSQITFLSLFPCKTCFSIQNSLFICQHHLTAVGHVCGLWE